MVEQAAAAAVDLAGILLPPPPPPLPMIHQLMSATRAHDALLTVAVAHLEVVLGASSQSSVHQLSNMSNSVQQFVVFMSFWHL